jgi:hypothetical protein
MSSAADQSLHERVEEIFDEADRQLINHQNYEEAVRKSQ